MFAGAVKCQKVPAPALYVPFSPLKVVFLCVLLLRWSLSYYNAHLSHLSPIILAVTDEQGEVFYNLMVTFQFAMDRLATFTSVSLVLEYFLSYIGDQKVSKVRRMPFLSWVMLWLNISPRKQAFVMQNTLDVFHDDFSPPLPPGL